VTLPVTVAAPFKHTRKDRLKKSEFVFYLAIDRKWMSREEAHRVLERAAEEGLLEVSPDGWVRPLLDLSAVTVPVGFRPSSRILETVQASQELIQRIATQGGITPAQVTAEVNRVTEQEFDGKIRLEAAVVLVAKRRGVPFDDLVERLTAEMMKGQGQADTAKKPQ